MIVTLDAFAIWAPAVAPRTATIIEAPAGFPGFSARIPFENGTIAEVLGERGWNTYAYLTRN